MFSDTTASVIGVFALGIAAILFLSFVLSWPVYMLWNLCLVGAVQGVNEVTWLQAWGLTALFGMLFKSSTSSSK
jgi:hypothetical protein